MAGSRAVVQVLEDKSNIDNRRTKCKFTVDIPKMGLPEEMMGQSFNRSNKVICLPPNVLTEAYLKINCILINPSSCNYPKTMIQTDIFCGFVNPVVMANDVSKRRVGATKKRLVLLCLFLFLFSIFFFWSLFFFF